MKQPPTEQARRAKALEALGSYQKRGQLKPEVEHLRAALNSESDRGIVVIIGSYLEDHVLGRLLTKFRTLLPPEQKNLIRSGGLLSSFADKVALAFALKLIDRDTVDSLEVIKALRNACAHSRQDISFTTPELRDALSLLFAPDEVAQMVRESEDPRFLRFMFVLSAVYLFSILKGEGKRRASKHVDHIMDVAIAEARAAKEKYEASRKRPTARPSQRSRPNPKG